MKPRVACILASPKYKPHDPPPESYLAWHEWAGVQYKAGLRQIECGCHGRWLFPSEREGHKFYRPVENPDGLTVRFEEYTP